MKHSNQQDQPIQDGLLGQATEPPKSSTTAKICQPFTLHYFPKQPRKSNLPSLTVPNMVVPIKKLTKQFGVNQNSQVPETAIWQGDTLETLGLNPQKMDIIELNELISENRKNMAAIAEQQHIAMIAAREKERIAAQEAAKLQMRREIEAELRTNTP